jgi:hypothetical protein
MCVQSLKGRISHEEDSLLTQAFDTHIQRVMRQLSFKVEGVEDPFLQQGEIIMAKHQLYDVCFEEAIKHANNTSAEFGAVLRKLRQIHQKLFSDYPAVRLRSPYLKTTRRRLENTSRHYCHYCSHIHIHTFLCVWRDSHLAVT